jgi:hypothetical protein
VKQTDASRALPVPDGEVAVESGLALGVDCGGSLELWRGLGGGQMVVGKWKGVAVERSNLTYVQGLVISHDRKSHPG